MKAVNYIGFKIVSYFGHLFYFAGLTSIIPLLPLLLSPIDIVSARFAFFSALFLIGFGCLLIFGFADFKKGLRVLGWTTLFPGLLAVVFNFIGPRRMELFLSKSGVAAHIIDTYTNVYVPSAWSLAGFYIILGVFLVWFSEK